MNTTTSSEAVRPLTRKDSLHQWLKRTQEVLAHRSLQGLPFSRLYDLMRTKRLTELALDAVLANEGSKTAGIDGITREHLKTVESQQALVEEINRELCAKTYKPRPVRRTYIPKDNGDLRPLGIPTIKDRVVQEMLRAILEPIYEGKFYKHSYGFRPFRSTHHAALRLKDLIGNRGYKIAIEGDIRKCFDRIHHLKLLQVLRQTIQDERVLWLVRAMLKSGAMEDGAWQVTDEGTPQGGIVSPLLANIYLNELDQYIAAKWEDIPDVERTRRRRKGEALPCYIVRYADDFVVLVHGTREQAEDLKAEIAAFLQNELHLELSAEKTLVTEVERGFDFLGFNIRKYQRATLITPSHHAMNKFRRKVTERIEHGFKTDIDSGVIEYVNHYLIGWGMYYRRVSSARAFRQADTFVWWRVFRTSHRYRNPKLPRREHYKQHYIPYRFDVRTGNRWRQGANYGVWADSQQTVALIIIRLAFIPIRYINQHPQLHPYVPEQRARLEKVVGQLELPPDQRVGDELRSEYGWEWHTLRQHVLSQAGNRCWRCQKRIKGRQAHIHHRVKLRYFKNRRQANLIDNLVPLCSACHVWAERQRDSQPPVNA